VKDFVELLATSEDFAMGISILLTTTGAADCVAVAEGVGDGEGDGEGAGAGIIFPESHARTVLPFDFVLIQV
jgi:hypothetical protein